MKYVIEYTETIRKSNTVTIEVESEEQGEKLRINFMRKQKITTTQMIFSMI